VTSIFPAIRLEHALTIIIAMGQLPHRAIADYYLSLMLSPLKLNLKETVVASVVFGFVASFTMALTTFAWLHRKSSKNNANEDDNNTERITSLFIPDKIQGLFSAKKEKGKGQLVPTLSAIIKAGDQALYNSSLWNGMHGHPGELTLEMIYNALERASRNRTTAERSAFPIRSISGESNTLKRGKSVGAMKEGRYEFQPRTQRSSMDILERGLVRSKSRRSAPMLVSMAGTLKEETGTQTAITSWTKDVQHAQHVLGRKGVAITPAELTALGLILGCLPEQSEQAYDFDKGAFGISISSRIVGENKRHIHLTQHKRPLSHLPGKGSGYSALVTKHLPLGSLPYAQTRTSVDSILVTASTFQALQTGTTLHLQDIDSQTSASTFLLSLPSSRTTTFHILTPVSTHMPSEAPSVLINAIAALPFTGGLVPLASTPIVSTVQFISSGGLSAGRLLQRLDALVEKVHRHSPHLHLFGPILESGNAGLRFREGERLGRLATGATVEDTVGAKAARMQRYVTLVERLMALVPVMKPEAVLAAVTEATKLEMERSYEDAVAAFKNEDADQEMTMHNKRNSTISNKGRKTKRLSSSSFTRASTAQQMPSPPTLTRSATPPTPTQTTPLSPASLSVNSSRDSSTFPRVNLGRQIEDLLKLSLPMDVQSIAKLVRLVIVAWTVSVEHVELEQLALSGDEKLVLF
jgi:hypothetical protein